MYDENALIKKHKGLVFRFLWNCRSKWRPWIEPADAKQAARIGLLKAIRTHDKTRQTKLSTWAWITMREALQEELRQRRKCPVATERNPKPTVVDDPAEQVIADELRTWVLFQTMRAARRIGGGEDGIAKRFAIFWLVKSDFTLELAGRIFGISKERARSITAQMDCELMQLTTSLRV